MKVHDQSFGVNNLRPSDSAGSFWSVSVVLVALLIAWPTQRLRVGWCQQHAVDALTAPFSPQAARQAQQVWAKHLGRDIQTTNSIGMSMMLIPPGEFMMGSPEKEVSLWDMHQDDELLHRVRITRPFRLGVHLVRVRDFRAFVCDTGYQTQVDKDGRERWAIVDGLFKRSRHFNWRNPGVEQSDDFPVVNVSWNDAFAFCNWLGRKEGKRYRLATEAEWEYACRAGTTSPFSFGNSCNGTEANCNGNHPYGTATKGPYLQRTCAVGPYAANAFGLYDMSGNVNQWCSDWYTVDYFTKSPIEDPQGPDKGVVRALRGGGWYNWAQNCRSAERGGAEPDEDGFDCGFRVVCEP